ncbi:MAG TPA: serine/threonine-protein kinase [Streptosporangiaceae bacterium]
MQGVTGSGRVVASRYQLLSKIGAGATGTVWRTRDLVLGRDVAIKEVHVPALMTEQDRRVRHERSLREARVAARLSHPGVVTVHDVIEAEGNPWIVMELVTGRSLAQLLANDGPVPPAWAAQMGAMLVGALASAHAAGIVHRDVKPANVLVTAGGRAVLTDFGMAFMAGDPHLTQVGMVMGTPGFCAPERIRGEPASPASDLWSLGATLYAAVAGYGPFDGRGTLMAVLASIVHDEPPIPARAGCLGPVIQALMRKDPAARPDAATASGLLAAAGGTPEPDGGRQAPDRTDGAGRPATATASVTRPSQPRPGRHRRALARQNPG